MLSLEKPQHAGGGHTVNTRRIGDVLVGVRDGKAAVCGLPEMLPQPQQDAGHAAVCGVESQARDFCREWENGIALQPAQGFNQRGGAQQMRQDVFKTQQVQTGRRARHDRSRARQVIEIGGAAERHAGGKHLDYDQLCLLGDDIALQLAALHQIEAGGRVPLQMQDIPLAQRLRDARGWEGKILEL